MYDFQKTQKRQPNCFTATAINATTTSTTFSSHVLSQLAIKILVSRPTQLVVQEREEVAPTNNDNDNDNNNNTAAADDQAHFDAASIRAQSPSIMSRKRISDVGRKELQEWLNEQHINPTKMARDFSDAVAVAQLLKKTYPKLIDLHNYPPRNSNQLKQINWETLNQKVLTKLGLQQSRIVLERLAKGTPGAMEGLLYEIMRLERSTTNRLQDDVQHAAERDKEQKWSENDDVVTINISRKVGDALVQIPQKMILYSIYEQTLRDSQNKDTQLTAAQQKVAHLENILQLKTERIDELCAQLAKLSVRSLLRLQNADNTSSETALEK